MSQQINLYDASLQRKHDLLTARNVAAACGVLLVLLVAWGGLARSRLGGLEGESRTLSPQVMALQAQRDAMTAQLSTMKPDQQLEAELAAARARFDLHTRQLSELKKGVGNEANGFAEYLRGLARQTPAGLWLTGFAIADGGASMEIRGRMMDPALLPEYIRRLNGEHVFKGHEFSALRVAAGKMDEAPAAPAPAAVPPGIAGLPGTGQPATGPAGQPAAPSRPATAGPAPVPAAAAAPFYEFSLAPMLRSTDAPAAADARPAMPGGLR